MPCLHFNEAINVSFVEFGEVLKSSCKFEFLTLLEPAVILKEGNKIMTHINFCKSPFSWSVPDTSHSWPWRYHEFEDNTHFYETENAALGQDTKEGPKNLTRSPPNPTLNTDKHTGNQFAVWLVVTPCWHASNPRALQISSPHTHSSCCWHHHQAWGPEVPEAECSVLSVRDVCCLSPLQCDLQICVSTLFSITSQFLAHNGP